MKKLITLVAASLFALTGGSALAADTATAKAAPKAAAKTDKAEAKLVKPAGVTEEAWAKMSDADKKKAMAMADKNGDKAKTAAAPKKEKKGGC